MPCSRTLFQDGRIVSQCGRSTRLLPRDAEVLIDHEDEVLKDWPRAARSVATKSAAHFSHFLLQAWQRLDLQDGPWTQHADVCFCLTCHVE